MSCRLGCDVECKAKAHGCASECPALPWQPGGQVEPQRCQCHACIAEHDQRGSLYGGCCTYPECSCPIEAPANPDWCGRGLPRAPRKLRIKTDYYGDSVRVQFLDARCPVAEDIVVERKLGDEWVTVRALNSMTSDLAYTEARRIAERTQREMAALESGPSDQE